MGWVVSFNDYSFIVAMYQRTNTTSKGSLLTTQSEGRSVFPLSLGFLYPLSLGFLVWAWLVCVFELVAIGKGMGRGVYIQERSRER